MKIIHIIDSLDPTKGGPSLSVPSLAAAQAHLGHNVSIAFLRDGNLVGTPHEASVPIPHFNKVDLSEITSHKFSNKFFTQAGAQVLSRLIADSDIVHMHGVWDPFLIYAGKLSIQYKKKFIFAPRGMLHPWSLNQKKWRKKFMLFFLMKKILNNCTFIHALNQIEAQTVKKLNIRSPIKIFPNGIFPNQFEKLPAPGSFYKFFPSLKKRPFILFLARLHYVKGLDYVADVFAEISQKFADIDLVIAGPDKGAKKSFEKKIIAHGVKKRVHIVGPLYGEKKFAALMDAKCFFLPSRQEGFSVSIVEAMAMAVPVVISENCNFPEIAQHEAGLVSPLKRESLIDALSTIILNEQFREKIAAAGKNLIFSNYSWYTIAKNILDEYDK